MINPSNWGIKTRVLLAVGLPVCLLTFVLTFYIQMARNTDLENELKTSGTIISNQLAVALEYAVATNNINEIKSLVERSMSIDIVIAIIVSDDKGVVLYDTGSEVEKNHQVLSYKSTITSNFLEQESLFNQEYEPELKQKNILGFTEVFLHQKPYLDRQDNIFWNAIYIAITALFISLGFAIFISRSVTTPVVDIIELINKIQSGDLDARFKNISGGEIGRLQENLNQMTSTIQQHQESLELKVENAVTNLNSKLMELEKKNIQLEQAEKAALLSKNAKASFLASMSHEIRTPLSAVIGFSQLLRKENLRGQVAEYSESINFASKQLMTIINDILNFSKLESGQMELESVEFSIRDCLEKTFFLLSQSASEKSIELLLIIDQDIPDMVKGDASRLSQVVMNIANNAIKFTDKGRVVASLKPIKTQGYFQLTVNDTGCGIGLDAQEKLFSPFYQENQNINKMHSGTGLGLVISKRLIELMGGELSFSSQLNKGSEFSISFPLQTIKQYKPAVLFTPALSILLFDSDQQSLFSHRDYLQPMHLLADTAVNKNELIRQLKSKQSAYDMVLLSLPSAYRMDCFVDEYLSDVRKYFDGQVVVLLLGGNTFSTQDFSQMDDRLSIIGKPIRKDSLLQFLTSYKSKDSNMGEIAPLLPTKMEKNYNDCHVLIAEDSQLNQLYLSKLLEKHSVKISIANTGEEAIELCKRNTFDLILMDLHMPVIDGFLATTTIRALANKNAKVAIISITADIFANENDQLINAGFTDVLFKPIDDDKLEQILATYLDLSSSLGQEKLALEEVKSDIEHTLPKFPTELIEKLFVNLYDSYEQLKTLLLEETVDQNQVQEAAHSLLGVVCYFQVPDLDQQIRKIQSAIKQANYPLALSLLAKCLQQTQQIERDWCDRVKQ